MATYSRIIHSVTCSPILILAVCTQVVNLATFLNNSFSNVFLNTYFGNSFGNFSKIIPLATCSQIFILVICTHVTNCDKISNLNFRILPQLIYTESTDNTSIIFRVTCNTRDVDSVPGVKDPYWKRASWYVEFPFSKHHMHVHPRSGAFYIPQCSTILPPYQSTGGGWSKGYTHLTQLRRKGTARKPMRPITWLFLHNPTLSIASFEKYRQTNIQTSQCANNRLLEILEVISNINSSDQSVWKFYLQQ